MLACEPGARPPLHALARAWVRHGARNVPTRWHKTLNTDAFSLRLLAYLDGSRDRAALIEALLADVVSGALQLPGDSQSAPRRRQGVTANVDRLLALFTRNGLLEAGA